MFLLIGFLFYFYVDNIICYVYSYGSFFKMENNVS